MKPRIYVKHGIWHCMSTWMNLPYRMVRVGLGYTPQTAYLDWLKETK